MGRMKTNDSTLSHEAARRFYDAFGAKQDKQAFYEDRATQVLLAHADFASAQAVCEFGCGTGRFAADALLSLLSANATYVGCDQSTTMVDLARARLAPYGLRATVQLSDGTPCIDAADATCDRFVSNYVLDLLAPADITALIACAFRVLRPGGLLCLVSLTHGTTPASRLVMWLWRRIHRLRPSLVGGCRALALLDYIDGEHWQIVHRSIVVAFGIPSEVVVARRR